MYSLFKHKTSKQFHYIEKYFTDNEVEKIIRHTEDVKFSEAQIGGPNEERVSVKKGFSQHVKETSGVRESKRRTNIKWIEVTEDNEWLYDKIIACVHDANNYNFGFILQSIEVLQFGSYDSKDLGFYGKHKDIYPHHRKEVNMSNLRKLSVSVQLSDPSEYEGGDLILYPEIEASMKSYHEKDNHYIMPKSKGTIIFFESDSLHEVTPVTGGNRKSLVTWINGPNFR